MKNVYYIVRELPRNKRTDNVRASYNMHTNREEKEGREGGGVSKTLKEKKWHQQRPKHKPDCHHCLSRADQVGHAIQPWNRPLGGGRLKEAGDRTRKTRGKEAQRTESVRLFRYTALLTTQQSSGSL